MHSVFNQFRQAKFANGGLAWAKFSCCPSFPEKCQKWSKIDSKKIISLPWSALCVPKNMAFINCQKHTPVEFKHMPAKLKCTPMTDPDPWSYDCALYSWVFNCLVIVTETLKNRGSTFMYMKVRISGTQGRIPDLFCFLCFDKS